MTESKKQTIVAFVRLVCTLVAAAAAMFGFAVDAEALFTGVACILAFVFFVWAWYRNNNVTDAATEAQEVLDMIKSRDKALKSDPIELEAAE